MTLQELRAHHLAEAGRHNEAAGVWANIEPHFGIKVEARVTACLDRAKFHLDAVELIDRTIVEG